MRQPMKVCRRPDGVFCPWSEIVGAKKGFVTGYIDCFQPVGHRTFVSDPEKVAVIEREVEAARLRYQLSRENMDAEGGDTFDKMSGKELELYAREKFNVELDRRKRHEFLAAQVRALAEAADDGVPMTEPEPEEGTSHSIPGPTVHPGLGTVIRQTPEE